MTFTATSTSTELFRSSWSLYDAIIGANYMFHREIAARVGQVMTTKSAGGFSVLDLGCGNARGLAATLLAAPPELYVGVDLSRAALDEAATTLTALPVVRLVEEDMMKCLESLVTEGKTFDVVHSAFAVHHLCSEDKRTLFGAIARVLAPGGRLLLVDVLRGAGQSREAYIDAYLKMVDDEWLLLTAEQRRQVREHVTAFDFPETVADLNRMSQDASLGPCELLEVHRGHGVMACGAPG